MKLVWICLVAVALSGCGMSPQQKKALAETQKSVEQYEARSLKEQQQSDRIKEKIEWLERLTPQQRLEFTLSELKRQTAETDQTTQGGALLGCVLGLVRCGN